VVVQHHHAHASALAGEHPDIEAWLVFTWDGVGYGTDGALWGGEALLGGPGRWRRVASFRNFKLAGGDRAGREPWRSAAALLWAEGSEWLPAVDGARLARDAWLKNLGVSKEIVDRVMGLGDAIGPLVDGVKALAEGDVPGAVSNFAAAISEVAQAILGLDDQETAAIATRRLLRGVPKRNPHTLLPGQSITIMVRD